MLNMTELFKGHRKYIIIVGLLCIALLSYTLLTDGINKKDNDRIAGIPNNAEELFKFKTSYVGDNAKVINLFNKLAYGNRVSEVSLQTKAQPYGVIVEYDFRDLKYDSQELKNSFEANAILIFALIDNVDNITFKVEGLNEPVEFTYLRTEMQKRYNADLREYSKDNNMLQQLLDGLIFRVSVYPEKYALTMSSTPGMKLSANYYGIEAIDRVRFSSERGAFFNWDTATGKISDREYSVELPYGNKIYWSPISDRDKVFQKDDKVITVAYLDKGDKVLGEKKIIITVDESFNYTVKPALVDNK